MYTGFVGEVQEKYHSEGIGLGGKIILKLT
jgi:hypothetical protein